MILEGSDELIEHPVSSFSLPSSSKQSQYLPQSSSSLSTSRVGFVERFASVSSPPNDLFFLASRLKAKSPSQCSSFCSGALFLFFMRLEIRSSTGESGDEIHRVG